MNISIHQSRFTGAAFLLIALSLSIFSQTISVQSVEELITRAKTSIQQGNNDAAILDLTAVIKIQPGNQDAYIQRSWAYLVKQNFELAMADAEKALTIDPSNAIAHSQRGMVKNKMKDYDGAIVDFTRAIDLLPTFYGAYFNRGLAYGWRSVPDWKAAQADFTKIIELYPGEADAYFERAWDYTKLEKWAEAEKDYLQAQNLGLNNALLFINLGHIHATLGKYGAAVKSFRAALAIDPKNQMAQQNLDYALSKQAADFRPYMTEQLLSAASNNNTKAALDALSQNANPNVTFKYYDITQITPLHIAVLKGNFELTKALVEAGADVNAVDSSGSTPLHRIGAYSENYGYKTEILNFMIKNGANLNLADKRGETPISNAILLSYDELVDLMIKAGASVNLKYGAGDITPLMTAIQSGSIQSVRLLLAAGANPNAISERGFTPLLYAVWRGGYGMIKAWLLLRAGARAAQILDGEFNKDYQGALEAVRRMASIPKDSSEAKLFDAVADNQTAEFSALLAANSTLDQALLNYLLIMSIWNDNVQIMQSLTAKGADINYKMDGDSILTMAKNSKKNAAAALAANYTTPVPEVNTTAQNEAKIAVLINNATNAMNYATQALNKGLAQRDAGREKSIWCLKINEAANDINGALRLIKQAQTIFTFKYKAAIQKAKEDAERSLSNIRTYGCPISLQQ